jgi:hypothetical protein
MSQDSDLTRRHFLACAGGAAAIGATPALAIAGAPPDEAARASERKVETAAESDLLQSQPLPQPKVILPTDLLPPPEGAKKRIAAITTAYFRYSHADDIITKFMEGYAVVGRTHLPHCAVVSLYVDQFPETDIGRGLATRARIPLCGTVEEALTLGTDRLAVDGVLLVGEHGSYPFNSKGQQLYPRRRLFEEVVKVFVRSGRSVPVYNDKHFSYSWLDAQWMYRQSRTIGFPMMAGSSVPVAWREPPLAFRPGIALESALAVGFGGVEVYGFHVLELLQAFVERRRGGETGVRAVQCLEGPAAWDAADKGLWQPELLLAAMRPVPGLKDVPSDPGRLRQADPNAVVFLVDYSDGFRAAAYVSRILVREFAFAARVAQRSEPVSTWCILNKPQRDHFSFLCNHIEVMFRTCQPSYPVERTYLVTGILAALMDSRAAKGERIATPHLAELGYTPAPEITVASLPATLGQPGAEGR